MRSYVFISITALYFYTLLMLAFMSVKKLRLTRDFIAVLGAMIPWTDSSFLMGLRAWPSYELWLHPSPAGISLVPCMFFRFIRNFCGHKAKSFHRMWLVLTLLVNLYNIQTGSLVQLPAIEWNGASAVFVCHMDWRVSIIHGLCFLVIIRTAAIIWSSRKNGALKAKMVSLLSSILLLFTGNMAVPLFNGFPIDILLGVLGAGMMFYMLYSRYVSRVTLLVSRGDCYIIVIAVSVLAFYNVAQTLDGIIHRDVPMLVPPGVMIMATMTTLVTLLTYMAARGSFDRIFIKEGVSQTECLSEYTTIVLQSLRLTEILGILVNVIGNTLYTRKIYICIRDSQGNYSAVFSSNSLDGKNFFLAGNAPLINWLKSHDSYLLLKDFRRTVEYKSMREEKKYQMEVLKIECILFPKDGNNLVGPVLLGGRERRGKMRTQGYSGEDAMFPNSIESIGSIAVKNSRLYERVYGEARADEPTGLLNQKYSYRMLEENYKEYRRTSLALVIFNVDNFKLYNQLYGNHEGDKALVHIARTIQGTVGDNGYCGRYSDKEFVVILPDHDTYSAQNLARNISRQIQDMNLDCTDTYLKPPTVSYRIHAAPYAAVSMSEPISNADCAAYHVKRSGKNGIRVYSDGTIGVEGTDEGLVKRHRSMYSEYIPTIYALIAAIGTKNHYTFQHSKNMAYYAHAMGQALETSEEYQEILRELALSHDVGKVGISESILNKTGKLTDEEYSTIKHYVGASMEIICHLPSMDHVTPAVPGHHERYGGRGRPRRITGRGIPLVARILYIADPFDATVSKRSYKPSMSIEFIVNKLGRGAGAQFDPELMPVFIGLLKDGMVRPTLNDGNGVRSREPEGTDAEI